VSKSLDILAAHYFCFLLVTYVIHFELVNITTNHYLLGLFRYLVQLGIVYLDLYFRYSIGRFHFEFFPFKSSNIIFFGAIGFLVHYFFAIEVDLIVHLLFMLSQIIDLSIIVIFRVCILGQHMLFEQISFLFVDHR